MPDKTLEKILEKILEVINPDKIILFGSRAKGTARDDSDYDLLIIKSGIDNKRKIAKKIYLNLNLPVSVDIIVQTPEGIEENKTRFYSIVNEAFNEGKVIYEQGS